MDFVSNNFLDSEKMGKKEFQIFFNIYQQLGLAWEFLGLQCKHWDGYKKTRDKNETCKICGKVKGADDFYILLTRKGPLKLGVKVKPIPKDSKPKKMRNVNRQLIFMVLCKRGYITPINRLFGKEINIAAVACKCKRRKRRMFH
jgi:hypothetical protein